MFCGFLILSGIIFTWFFNIQLPFGINITDSSIIALFTIVLAGATIVNIFIYNRSLSLSRLSTIDVWLEDNFYVRVLNMGDFGIKNVSVEMEIIEKPPKKSSFKEKFRINLINRVKDLLDTEEKKIRFIASHKNKRKDFFGYASKRLNLKKKSDKYNNSWVEFKKKEKKRDIFVRLSINYFTDTLSKSPRPFIKIFKIIFKEKKLIEVEEID